MSQRQIMAAGLLLALMTPALAQSDSLQQSDGGQGPPLVQGTGPETATPEAVTPEAVTPETTPDLLSGTAALEENANTPVSAPAPQRTFIFEQSAMEFGVTTLIGMPVVSARGEKLGTVDDVMVNQRGQVQGLLVSTGGFFGFGAKSVGINWRAIRQTLDQNVLTVDLSGEQLAEAPAYLTREDLEAAEELKRRALTLDPLTPVPPVSSPAVPSTEPNTQ